MADRFPLILNTSTNQIQEIPSGDNLDLTGTGINNAGIITATTFKGDGDFVELDVDGHTNLDNVSVAGVSTFTGNADFSAGVDVTGDINVTSTLPVINLIDSNNNDDFAIKNVDGVFTIRDATNGADRLTINSNGKTTFPNDVELSSTLTIESTQPTIQLNDTNANDDFAIRNVDGVFGIRDITNGANRLTIDSNGVVDVAGNTNFGAGIDVTGNATVSGNLSVGGVLTYEDVTNVDSIGIITARNAIDCNGDLDVDGHTNLDNISVAGVSTFTGNADFSAGVDVTGTIIATGEIRSQDDIRIQSTYPRLYLTDTDSNDDFSLINNNGSFLIYNDTQNAFRLKIDGTTGQCAMNLRPTTDSTFNLGTNTLRWQNLFVDDVTVTGVVTATAFSGDGSNLTGITQTTINNNANNRLITGSGTANTLEGESTLTYNGTSLALSAGKDIRFTSGTWTGEHAGKIQYHSNKLYFQGGSNGHQLRDNSGNTTFEINPSGTCAGVSLTLGQAVTHNADATFNGGAGAVTVAAASDIRIAGGTWTGEYTNGIKIQPDGTNSYIQYEGNLYLRDVTAANRFMLAQNGELYINSTADGVLNLNTTASNGAFMRFRKPSSSDTSLHVGVAKGIVAGSDTDDGAVYAGRGNLILRANSGTISFTDGGAATSGIDIVTRGGGTSGNDGNSLTSPFIRFRDYPASSYFNSTTVDDNNWAIGADDSGVSEFKIVYGGGNNSNRITSIQENNQTGTTVMGFQSDLQVTTTGFKISETAELAGTSSVGSSTRNAHYDATPGRGTYLVHGQINYRGTAPSSDPDQVRLVLQVDGSDIAHASILDEDSNEIERNRDDSFTALITVNGSQNVQVETYTTDPADAGGADYRYRINIYKLGG